MNYDTEKRNNLKSLVREYEAEQGDKGFGRGYTDRRIKRNKNYVVKHGYPLGTVEDINDFHKRFIESYMIEYYKLDVPAWKLWYDDYKEKFNTIKNMLNSGELSIKHR